MIKTALDAFKELLRTSFPEVKAIYTSWPSPDIREVYPYFLIFSGRVRYRRSQSNVISQISANKQLFSRGYQEVLIDLNYLSKTAEEDDKFDVIEKMTSVLGTSRDIPYMAHGSNFSCNIQYGGYQADESGPDLRVGDRRVIFNLNMLAPWFEVRETGRWRGYAISPAISEKTEIA